MSERPERRTAASASCVETNRAFFMQMLSLVRIAAVLPPNRRFRQARLCAWSGRSLERVRPRSNHPRIFEPRFPSRWLFQPARKRSRQRPHVQAPAPAEDLLRWRVPTQSGQNRGGRGGSRRVLLFRRSGIRHEQRRRMAGLEARIAARAIAGRAGLRPDWRLCQCHRAGERLVTMPHTSRGRASCTISGVGVLESAEANTLDLSHPKPRGNCACAKAWSLSARRASSRGRSGTCAFANFHS